MRAMEVSLEHLVLDGFDASTRARLIAALEAELQARFARAELPLTIGGRLELAGDRFTVDPSLPPERVARQVVDALVRRAQATQAPDQKVRP